MNELKPCPFCGAEAIAFSCAGMFYVKCVPCQVEILRNTRDEAVRDWNRRAQPANSRFANYHIWEPGDRLDTISDKCDVLIKAKDIKALMVQPANKPLTCEGCEHDEKWENEYEYGYPSPGTYCKRRASDHYVRKPEGSENE